MKTTVLTHTGKALVVCLTLGIATGCSSSGPKPPARAAAQESPGARLHYRGFSVASPALSGWTMRQEQQGESTAVFNRQLSCKDCSLTASVKLQQLPNRISSQDALARIVKDQVEEQFKGVNFRDRYEPVSYKQDKTTYQEQWAVHYENVMMDKKPNNSPWQPLKVITRGFKVAHPTLPNTIVHINYSFRGPEGELSPRIAREAEVLLSSVTIDGVR